MLKVAVIEGGYSHEKEVSLRSAETVSANLDASKYHLTRVRIDEAGWFVYEAGQPIAPINRNDFSYEINGVTFSFDYAFIVIHGTPGEDGKLQAYFDMLNIPYNTCNQLLSTLTFNKFVCNRFLSNFNVNVAKAALITKNQSFDVNTIIQEVGLPCFVKPADGGSSFGVSKVKTNEELIPAITKALAHGTQALIESFLKGREFTNGVFLGKNGVKVLPITEIVTKNEFFDFEAKYQGASEEITPALIDDSLTDKIKATTKRVFELLNMTGVARIDYIVVNEVPYLIEINTVPGQSAQSIIPQMAKVEGISLAQLFDEVIELSLKAN